MFLGEGHKALTAHLLLPLNDKPEIQRIEGFYDEVAPLNEMDEYYTNKMAEVLDEDMYLNKRFFASR